MKTWAASARVYLDRRILAVLCLGFSSGFPFGVLAEPFSAWLTEAGVSQTEIGLLSLASLPYALKFLWAPVIDTLTLPVLTARLGRRRGWTVLTQVLLALSILWLGTLDPLGSAWMVGLAAVAVSFCSASQDVVIDAYRVEILEEEKLGAGAATVVFGWRVGQVGAGAAGLIAADVLPWPVVFAAMAALSGVGLVAILLSPEPDSSIGTATRERERHIAEALDAHPDRHPALARFIGWFTRAVVGPFADFLTRPGAGAILAFILLYKFGDQVLSVMKIPFFLDLGFSKTEIAGVVKIFGFNAIIAGGFLSGWLIARVGILRGLMISGVLMAVSNLVFAAQALVGQELWMLTVTIAVENITTGMGTAAFVAYLSSLCNVAYTATQYALLTSLMALARTVMSSGAGYLADQVDWVSFFMVSTLAALPGLILLGWMMKTFPSKNNEL